MKHIFTTILALMLVVGCLFGQDTGGAQADMVKQRAKSLRDANNQQQGAAPATQPAATYTAPGAASTTPQGGMNPAQQALIDRLETDLKVLKPGVPATPQYKTGLQIDIESLVRGVIKPSKTNTFKLAADLADALADKDVTAKDLAQLARAVNVVVNSAPLPPARAQTFVTTAQNVLKSSGANDASVKAVGADLALIILEIQKAKPKLYQ